MSDTSPLYDNPASPQAVDPRDMTGQFNTKLSDEDEAKYQQWAKQHKREKDTYDYDMRGAWKDGGEQSENGHYPDTYKKPNHPTFSDESRYHKGEYKGGKWSTKDGRDTFTPGETNLKNFTPDEMRGYFKQVEPDSDLVLPEE